MWLAIRMMLYAVSGFAMGQGLDFYQFDEQSGQVDISFNIDDLTTFLVGFGAFGTTFVGSFFDTKLGPLQDESGGVRWPLAVGLGLILLSACAGLTPERAAAARQCQLLADEQGLPLLTPERNAYMAACLSAIATGAVIERLILDDDLLGGGGKL